MSAESLVGYVSGRISTALKSIAPVSAWDADRLTRAVGGVLAQLQEEGVLVPPALPPVLAIGRVGNMLQVAVGVDAIRELRMEIDQHPERFVQMGKRKAE